MRNINNGFKRFNLDPIHRFKDVKQVRVSGRLLLLLLYIYTHVCGTLDGQTCAFHVRHVLGVFLEAYNP